MKPLIRERVRGEHGEDFTIYGEHKILTHLPSDYQGVYEVPDWVTVIGLDAIRSCHELTSVKIPKNVTRICSGNFHFCDKLTSIIIDSANPIFDSRNNCNAVIVSVTNTMIHGCNGTIIPNGIESIEEGTFVGCSALQSLYIPASVKYIGLRFFETCPNLSSLTVDINNPVYDSRDNCNAIIQTSTNTLLCSCQAVESFVIPNNITGIGRYAFQGCRNMRSLQIPETVTCIGEYAFCNCNSLEGEIHLSNIGVLNDCVFDDCMQLSRVVVGSGICKIGRGAFCSCVNLREIVLSEGVREIGPWAFERCDSLKRIFLPSSIESIAPDAFKGCHQVTEVYIPLGTTEHFAEFEALQQFRWRFAERAV